MREHWPDVDVIMITGYGSIKNAVEAMRQGAVDYITKPFQPEELLHAVRKALERRRLIDEIEYLRAQLSDRYSFANMVSRAPAMLEIFATLEMLARNDVTVLITGESGTGKELAARAIHFQGKRRAGRFVAINCAAVPEALMESELFGYERGAFTGAMSERVGKVELANGGTLFLDEVESIPLPMQAKLLRVLEERAIERLGGNRHVQVDMRVVAATNVDLAKLVREGRVREDFYYRINVVPIALPPLRDRREDISLLVAEFLRSNEMAQGEGPQPADRARGQPTDGLRLAGQHPRALQRHGARGAAGQGRHHQRGRRADHRPHRRPARPGRPLPPAVARVPQGRRARVPRAAPQPVPRWHRPLRAPRLGRPGDAAPQDQVARSARRRYRQNGRAH